MTEELEPAAHIAEKSDYDVELVWNTEYSETGMIKDSLYTASDIIQLIEDRMDALSSEIEEIELKVIDSDCGISAEHGNQLRKWKCKRVEELENLKSSLEVED